MLLLQDVCKTYRQPDGAELPILNIPRFEVARGEQVVLTGRSGGGKTTLLHIIAGIALPDRGKVELEGVDITQLPEAARDRFRAEKMGYVFQTFNLLPAFSALENVLLGMTFGGRSADRGRAEQLLERVGLTGRLTHRPAALSVGEQQRVAVARALANHPALLLADEPTANIDAGRQQQVVELIRETCREENVALLMVTHTAEVAGQFERVEALETLNQTAEVA
ncbi:MAG: ABC transporter ATP-binding protein [Planctomycetota bacterium]|nr:MAG: ABC transporter ATP-binding protein [Planctomycetota bacterium]REK42163.1 MAG: ABC transporter ATP-binding protein [Planctomycetota bacterium]